MNLENQVCSLELAKRLKELSVKQESLFWWKYWIPKKGSSYIHDGWNLSIYKGSNTEDDRHEIISAFTIAELGEILPENYISCKTEGMKYPELKYKKYWLCYYDPDGCDKNTIMEESESDAREKMLVYLLENKLMVLPNEK